MGQCKGKRRQTIRMDKGKRAAVKTGQKGLVPHLVLGFWCVDPKGGGIRVAST